MRSTENISLVLFLLVQTKMKKKIQKLSVKLFSLAGNLHEEQQKPSPEGFWAGSLSDFPNH